MHEDVFPTELKAELDLGQTPLLLDVREEDELENGVIPGILHIPMDEVPSRLGELEGHADIVVICRTGNRSGRIADWLVGAGAGRVRNLVGGMNAWAEEVDPGCRPY